MTDIYKLFEEHIALPEDLTEAIWDEDGYSVGWNTENNIDDLANGDGETYSEEIEGIPVQIGNYILYNIRVNGRYQEQVIFSVDKKVDLDKYWEEHEE